MQPYSSIRSYSSAFDLRFLISHDATNYKLDVLATFKFIIKIINFNGTIFFNGCSSFKLSKKFYTKKNLLLKN